MQPGCTTGDGRKIFLSYSHEDRERASAVKMLLEVGGAQVFMDWRCVPPGIEWEPALEHALLDCDLLCVFWSAAALRSKWVRAEYTTFIRKFPDRRCIPLRADETPLPPALARKQAPPEFLALANEFLALRRELLASGVGQREQQRIVRDRLAQLALPLDDAQRSMLLKLFASGVGVSVGMLLTSLPKSLKAAGLIAALSVAFSLMWSPCSNDRPGDPRLPAPPDDTGARPPGPHPPRATQDEDPAIASERTADGHATSGGERRDDSCCTPSSSSGSPVRVDAQTPAIAQTSRPSTSGSSSGWNSSGWIKIGEADVRTGSDHVHLDVRQRDSKYVELMLSVKDSDLEIVDLKLTFDNREQLHMDTRRVFKEGSAESIVLPVNKPIMTNIELAYREPPEGDHPHLEVWAKPGIVEATRPAVTQGVNHGERASSMGSAQDSTGEPVSPATVARASNAPGERGPNAQTSNGGMVSPTIRISGNGTERVGPSPRAVDAKAGSATPAPARADGSDDQLASARNVLEGASAPQAIQMFVHGSGDLIRADYVGARRFTSGFRLFYTYHWKSMLFNLNHWTELSFDFDTDGFLGDCHVGQDSSFLPAFYEAPLMVETVRKAMLDNPDVKKRPKLVPLIQRADTPQLMILFLNLRASLALSRQ